MIKTFPIPKTRADQYRATRKKRVAYATRRALRIIRKKQPKTVEEAKLLGLGFLQYQGQGTFRYTYRINNTNLLIKFPIAGDTTNKIHTRMEVRKIRVLSKFKSLRAHLPPVYYYNNKDGVMVTKFYPNIAKSIRLNEVVTKLVKELTGVTLEDICGDNVRRGRGYYDKAIFVDLGY